MLHLIQIEVFKIFKRSRSYIGFIAIAAIVLVIELALYLDGQHFLDMAVQNLKDTFSFDGNLLNGYLAVFIILNSLWIHIPFLIALVAGDLLAGEAASGTFKLLLTRPISRFQLVLAKFTAGLIYTLSLILFMAVLSVGLGVFLFGKGDLMVVQNTIYIFSQEDVGWRIASAFAFSILSMTTVAALAFLFSAFADNSIGPIIGTMAVIIALFIFTSIDLSIFRAIKPYLFTNYLGAWRLFFEEPLNSIKITRASLVLSFHILLFFSITAFHFNRKDILT
ncbi:MAG: ABC transporter permease subunit [Bacteroidetes bacterium]|nr:ABC transporter permease subunit [Bacteroidota bacterium]